MQGTARRVAQLEGLKEVQEHLFRSVFKDFYIPNMRGQFKSLKKRRSKQVVKVLQPSFCQPIVLLLCRTDASVNVRVKGCCAV